MSRCLLLAMTTEAGGSPATTAATNGGPTRTVDSCQTGRGPSLDGVVVEGSLSPTEAGYRSASESSGKGQNI